MIFMHIGMHKTATTFFQNEVFPKWKDIEYIAWPNLEHFLRMDPNKNYLVSREGLSGQIWATHEVRDKCIKRLSELFPGAKILISFRRHDKYILSSYKQYLHKGGTLPFNEFFDIDDDKGFQKRDDLIFRKKLESIEKHFGEEPLVFLQEEIRSDFQGLLSDLEHYFGAKAPEIAEIRRTSSNKGVGYYPAKLLRRINKYSKTDLNPQGKYNLDNYYTRYLKIDPASICQNWLSFLPDKPLINKEVSGRIRDYYTDDWEYVSSYAKRRLK